MTSTTIRSNIFLLLAAIIWGGGFVAQRLGVQQLGPYYFNGFRFLIGALTLLPIFWYRRARGAGKVIDWKQSVLIGGIAGLFLFFGATFQQLGLIYTTAGKAGFITGLYVIIVPILGIFWGDRPPLMTWLGAALAVFGLYFLSTTAAQKLAAGDDLVLIGAVFWAIHVQFIARFSPRADPIQLSFVQSIIAALFSFGVAILREDLVMAQVYSAALPILYGGIISIGIAYTLQVLGQRGANPSHAAIILSLEAVFAAFWGWLLLQEIISGKILIGCLIMLIGMVVSQNPFSRSDRQI